MTRTMGTSFWLSWFFLENFISINVNGPQRTTAPITLKIRFGSRANYLCFGFKNPHFSLPWVYVHPSCYLLFGRLLVFHVCSCTYWKLNNRVQSRDESLRVMWRPAGSVPAALRSHAASSPSVSWLLGVGVAVRCDRRSCLVRGRQVWWPEVNVLLCFRFLLRVSGG